MDKQTLHIHNNKVIELLYQLREEKGLRQIDLAKRLDVNQSFISKYESGERKLDLIEVRLICNSMEISLVDFCEKLELKINAGKQ